ncbi:sugar phosphate nucleotidyltransferase [Pseudothermotoga lettingae]|nr:sugar phosphate nucleotidyltransferase [Pseudothermotoga lettingae]
MYLTLRKRMRHSFENRNLGKRDWKTFLATYSELPEIPKTNILLEPTKKNTAPACTFASLNFQEHETIFIVPADHYIPDTEKFWHCVEIAQRFIENHEGIITFGIVTQIETAHGYIQSNECRKNSKFHEKPNSIQFHFMNRSYFWTSKINCISENN